MTKESVQSTKLLGCKEVKEALLARVKATGTSASGLLMPTQRADILRQRGRVGGAEGNIGIQAHSRMSESGSTQKETAQVIQRCFVRIWAMATVG